MNRAAQLAIRIALPLAAAASLLASTGPAVTATDATDFPAGYTGYHTYAEMTADLQTVATAYGPGATNKIARLVNIGKSYEGRPIWAIKISDHPNRDEAEPEVLVECNMHAREHLTAEECLSLVHLLTDNYGQATPLGTARDQDRQHARDLDHPHAQSRRRHVRHQWRHVPRLAQEPPGERRLEQDRHRSEPKLGLQVGLLRVARDPNPKSSKYRGAYPFQAVEDQVLRDFILSRRVGGVQQIKEVLNVHSYGEHVLYPYGYTKEAVPADMSQDDHDTFVALATADGVAQRLSRDAGQRRCTSTTATSSTGHTATSTSSPSPGRCIRTWGCACGGFKPPDTVIAP